MNAMITDHLSRLIARLQEMDPTDAAETVMNEVIETGGTYVCPAPDHGTHLFEINLYNAGGYGRSESEAIRNWIKAARAQLCLIEGDGMITIHPPFPDPRNHAEEIANARAGVSS